MTKELILSRGLVALVDDEDYEWLNQWKWSITERKGAFYANRKSRETQKFVLLHREILNAPRNMEVDHINGDGLDNQRSNLRLATRSENMRNQPLHRDSTSGYKGVNWNKRVGKWRSYIILNYKQIHLGYFNDPIEAARVYDEGAKKYHGEFARLNFPNS